MAKLPSVMVKSMKYSERNPKSICRCSHSGDGGNSAHLGIVGHGACMFCPCSKFSWKGWTAEFMAFMGYDKKG